MYTIHRKKCQICTILFISTYDKSAKRRFYVQKVNQYETRSFTAIIGRAAARADPGDPMPPSLAECTKMRNFGIKIKKKFWGGAHRIAPSPVPKPHPLASRSPTLDPPLSRRAYERRNFRSPFTPHSVKSPAHRRSAPGSAPPYFFQARLSGRLCSILRPAQETVGRAVNEGVAQHPLKSFYVQAVARVKYFYF